MASDLGSVLGSLGIGGAIGQAIVRLELDTAKYQAEMKSAQASTVASTNAMGTSTSKFAGLAQTALLGVGVAAVAGAALSVKAAIEANEAHLKLQNTFANNAMLSDASVEAFEAQADALRDLTGVDDEAIISGQALLGQFDLTGQQVMELTPLVVDLSAKLGIDLDAAFKAAGKAATGNTGALARYIGAIEVGSTEAETFTNVVDKLGRAQGFAAERAKAEPWRVLGASFEEIAEQIGQALLPVIQDLSELLLKLLPIIEKVTQAIQFLPLVQMAEGFEQDGNAAEKFANVLLDSIPVVGHYTDVTGDLDDELGAVVADMVTQEGLISSISSAFREQLTPALEETKKHVKNFANLTNKELKELRQGTEEWVRDGIGDLESFEAKWHTTSEVAVRAMEGMAKQAKVMARDIKALDKEGVPDKFILFLREQGPDAVHEFVSGTEKQKGRFLAAWKAYEKAVGDSVGEMKHTAGSGGKAVGAALDQGLITAIVEGSPAVSAAAAKVVRDAIAAARRAAAAESPSKRMAELGVDMMIGLANGISDAEQKAIDAAGKAIENSISKVEEALSKIKDKASSFSDAIRSGFGGFLDLSGAFGLGSGGEISHFVQGQVAGATQLADILEALKRQGASRGLLSQIAGGGAEGVGFAQTLLQGGPQAIQEIDASLRTISELSRQTGKALSESFFGDRIDKVEKKLDQLHEDLRELNRLEREGHSHDIVMDGEKVAEGTRKQLIRTGSRNPDIFGGRA